MIFDDVIGQKHLINHLKTSAKKGRIPHAQLFVGKEGSGTLPMAIAYAQFLLCLENPNPKACALKCENLVHPDLHFAFPVATNERIKKHPISNLFLEDWRSFVKEQPYGNLFHWFQHIGVENKQGQIGVDEAEQIVKSLQLKPFEGGYKIMIVWMAEKLNTSAANKLLKLLEEPPQKTVFLLVVENKEQLLNTLVSRCQALHFPVLSEKDISDALIARENSFPAEATKIAHRAEGNYNKALHLLKNDSNDLVFENWFVLWVRTAFKAKGNASVVQNLIGWSDNIAKSGRETQKRFLHYCLQFFRQALLYHYGAKELVFLEPSNQGFAFEKFAPFVHGSNILEIEKEVSDALYHIERNGNAKIILLDLSVKLTRLLHMKES